MGYYFFVLPPQWIHKSLCLLSFLGYQSKTNGQLLAVVKALESVIFIAALAAQTAQTVKFMFSNVAYRPTLYKTFYNLSSKLQQQ